MNVTNNDEKCIVKISIASKRNLVQVDEDNDEASIL